MADRCDTVEQVASVTAALFESHDIIEIRRLPSTRCSWHPAIELAGITALLADDNLRGQNIYIGANPRPLVGARGDACIQIARSMFADFDHIESPQAAAERIGKAGMPMPTLSIWSGHGVHCYWRLVHPFTDLDRWSAFQMDLASLLDSDPVVFNAERIMRLAGFQNHKSPPGPAYVIFADPSLVYANEDILEMIPMVDDHWLGIIEESKPVHDLKVHVAHHVVRAASGNQRCDGVIGEWNRQVSVADVLARHRYSLNGPKFTRPGKPPSDGYSGHIVTCRDGVQRSIHFSANDLLNDGKFCGKRIACGVHDSFDAYRLLECGGDQPEAVRACARALGLERKAFTDAALIEACLFSAEGEEFERLYTGNYGSLSQEQALERLAVLLRSRTDFDKQIGRVLGYASALGKAGAE